ncbi:MAG: 50S ribosomal protein L22 [Candidatus Aureabacteria bacterium]|nr:50S ribosomal protein L22 [Candidatus Auribacterota bacterium]
MHATAKLRYFKMSPKKVRLVADLVRGKKLDEAVRILSFLPKKGARAMETLLRSAAANAGNKDGMDTETLFISKVIVNEGPVMKRFIPRAQGRATPILKRFCHIDLMLEDRPRPVKTQEEPAGEKPLIEGQQEQEEGKGRKSLKKKTGKSGAHLEAGVKKSKEFKKKIDKEEHKKTVKKPKKGKEKNQ